MRYGSTLPLDLFTAAPSSSSAELIRDFGSLDNLLTWLGDNLDAIEINKITANTDPNLLLYAVSICREHGLEVTIHGAMSPGQSADDFFSPYLPLFQAHIQESYTVTLHPLADANLNMAQLKSLLNAGHPVMFALENQRNRSDETRDWGCAPVSAAVASIDHPQLGTCLDFGHQLSNFHNFGPDFDPIPEEFFTQAVQTHIHSYYNGTTHFPLHMGETRLEENIAALLSAGYTGILNLELHAARYHTSIDVREALVRSVGILKDAVAQIEYKKRAFESFRYHFPETLSSVVSFINSTESGLGLIGPASYLLRLGDKKIAIDPSACDLPDKKAVRDLLFDTLREFDAVICTHFHSDHFDKSLLTRLAPHVPCYIPSFLTDIPEVHKLSSGEKISVGDAALTFFDSPHSRGESRVDELGFLLEYAGKKALFPIDVRTYDSAHIPQFGQVDTLVAHLWLGRKLGLDQVSENEYIRDFTAFAAAFAPKRTIIAHLCDPRRDISDMWSPLHVKRVEPYLSNPHPIFFGDTITL